MENPIKDLLLQVAWKTGLTRLLARNVRNGALVLAYHSTPAAGSKPGYEYAVPRDAIVQHLRFLAATGRVLPLLRLFTEQLARPSGAEDDGVRYAITTDDGYRSNYENLFPLLCDGHVSTTFFLTVGELQQTSETFLGWREVKEMHASGLVSFGVHCWRHVPLTAMAPGEAEEDLTRAKKELEDRLGEECLFLAYPFGAYNSGIVEIVKKVGFRAAFADRSRPAIGGLFGVPRLTISGEAAPIEQAALKIARALRDTGGRPWGGEVSIPAGEVE